MIITNDKNIFINIPDLKNINIFFYKDFRDLKNIFLEAFFDTNFLVFIDDQIVNKKNFIIIDYDNLQIKTFEKNLLEDLTNIFEHNDFQFKGFWNLEKEMLNLQESKCIDEINKIICTGTEAKLILKTVNSDFFANLYDLKALENFKKLIFLNSLILKNSDKQFIIIFNELDEKEINWINTNNWNNIQCIINANKLSDEELIINGFLVLGNNINTKHEYVFLDDYKILHYINSNKIYKYFEFQNEKIQKYLQYYNINQNNFLFKFQEINDKNKY